LCVALKDLGLKKGTDGGNKICNIVFYI